MLGLFYTSKDAWVTFHKQGCLGYYVCCVRDAEGAKTTPSFGHPSYIRRDKGGTAFGGERSEVHLPVSLLIGGKGGGIPPNRREERCSPTRAKRGARPNVSSNSFYLQLAIISETNHNAINEA